MFIKRNLLSEALLAQKHFPVLLLTGPRQTGKTELLKHSFPEHKYYSFDAIDIREKAKLDPRSFFKSPKQKIILDEIQYAPELLSYVKEFVDQNKINGQVILTGSHQFQLMQGVTESLAGRVAILQLLPFCFDEVKKKIKLDLGDCILKGFYPQVVLQPGLNLNLWFDSYINTYLQKDLRSQIQIRDLKAFETLLKLLATKIGQELNLNRLAADVGVSAMTVKAWLAALEASYVIYFLQPYYKNFGKRLVKSPKLYFIDTGLACHLLQLKTSGATLHNPISGWLFENFVISELLKLFYNRGEKAPLYFWRSHDGLEIDIVLDQGLNLTPIEIKLTHTITNQHIPNLVKFKQLAKSSKGIVISQSLKPALTSEWHHCHWSHIQKLDFSQSNS